MCTGDHDAANHSNRCYVAVSLPSYINTVFVLYMVYTLWLGLSKRLLSLDLCFLIATIIGCELHTRIMSHTVMVKYIEII